MRHLPCFVLASAVLAACAGDHSFLAQKVVDAGAPAVEDARSISDVVAEERRAPPADPPRDASGPIVDVADPEPAGPWTLTFLNGLTDAEAARFCFVPVVGGRENPATVGPEPAGSALPFGSSMVFRGLPGVDWATVDVHPYVVLGAADGGAGTSIGARESCADILKAAEAGTSEDGFSTGPVVASLPMIPAGTLVQNRSYLAVVTGCARRWPFQDAGADANEGGDADAADAHDGDAEAEADVFRPPARAAICGSSSSATGPGLLLVRLSRIDVRFQIGFQAVHASNATPAATIELDRADSGQALFAANLALGQIAPRTMPTSIGRSDFGPTLGSATLRVTSSSLPSLDTTLAAALDASGIEEFAIEEGNSFSMVLVGAEPGQNPGPPWQPARVVVVRNAPLGGRD